MEIHLKELYLLPDLGNIKYLDLIQSIDATIIKFNDLIKLPIIDKRYLIIRHDVDETIESAIKMARYENIHGLKSTYFLLHGTPYFNNTPKFKEYCLEIKSLGHDIGLHNDAIGIYYLKNINIVDSLWNSLNLLRSFNLEIIGTSAHGSQLCYDKSFYNYEIWKEFDPKKNEGLIQDKEKYSYYRNYPLSYFGLKYEAYFTPYNIYLSEPGWGASTFKWVGHIYNEGDIKLYERTMKASEKNIGLDVIKKFNNMSKGVFQLLVHPNDNKWLYKK